VFEDAIFDIWLINDLNFPWLTIWKPIISCFYSRLSPCQKAKKKIDVSTVSHFFLVQLIVRKHNLPDQKELEQYHQQCH
jgi:hypothetical protein